MADVRDGRAADAVGTFDALGTWGPVERWKPDYGQGTALLAAGGSPTQALFHLDRALVAVPDDHRCEVQTNRALALQLVGDDAMARAQEHAGWVAEAQQLAASGQPVPEDAPWAAWTVSQLIDAGMRWAESASTRYGDAADARTDPSCEDQQDEQEQQQAQDDAQDLRDRQGQADDLGDQLDPDAQQDQQPQPDTPEGQEQQRQQELEQRNQEAQERAREEAEEGLGGGGGTQGW